MICVIVMTHVNLCFCYFYLNVNKTYFIIIFFLKCDEIVFNVSHFFKICIKCIDSNNVNQFKVEILMLE